MIIYLTSKSGKKIGVNFNMVTCIEDCGEESEVHFPHASISVKESLDKITTLVNLQNLMKEIRK